MNKRQMLLMATIMIGAAFLLSGCGKKTANTNAATNSSANANTVVTEAPFAMSGATKVFNLKLVNGLLNYKTMTFYAGDTIEIRLTTDGQPADFKFQNIPAESVNGIFGTSIAADDKGGTYNLICKDRECGSIAVTVIPNASANANTNSAPGTNATANTNAAGVTNVTLQRLAAGTAFSPGLDMETTAAFKTDDQFGLTITGTFKSGDKSTFSITDSSGKTVAPPSMQSNLQNGSNGSCCFSLPETAGSYNVNVFVNGVAAKSVPITVTAR